MTSLATGARDEIFSSESEAGLVAEERIFGTKIQKEKSAIKKLSTIDPHLISFLAAQKIP